MKDIQSRWPHPLGQPAFRLVLTVATGSIGGLIFHVMNLPLPWLLGALGTTMVAALFGAPLEVRKPVRKYLVVILGIMLGGTFTPEVVQRAGDWIPTLMAAVGYLGIITLVAQLYCRKVMSMNRPTALFSGMPGGLSEMVILGEENGADVHVLTLTHAVRVASVLLAIPFFLTYWIGLDNHAAPPPVSTWSIRDGALLVVCAAVGVVLGKTIRLPAYHLTGPMLCSAVLHLTGLIVGGRPAIVSIVVQLAMGSALGSRFFGVAFRNVARLFIQAVGLAFAMMSVTLLTAWVLAQLTGLGFEALVLALSPGGFAEMALAALSMNIDPAFVTTHHGLRLFIVVFIAPIVLSIWIKR